MDGTIIHLSKSLYFHVVSVYLFSKKSNYAAHINMVMTKMVYSTSGIALDLKRKSNQN